MNHFLDPSSPGISMTFFRAKIFRMPRSKYFSVNLTGDIQIDDLSKYDPEKFVKKFGRSYSPDTLRKICWAYHTYSEYRPFMMKVKNNRGKTEELFVPEQLSKLLSFFVCV